MGFNTDAASGIRTYEFVSLYFKRESKIVGVLKKRTQVSTELIFNHGI